MSSDNFSDLFPSGALEGVIPEGEVCVKRDKPERRIWSVSSLLFTLREQIDIAVGRIWVEGEISNLSIPASGHRYFTLKEKNAGINAVIFKNRLVRNDLPKEFPIENGQRILCFGRPDIYTVRGELQFIVERIEPCGRGALAIAFEVLKNKLAKEGLFEGNIKRPLPSIVERVYLVTSPTGAVVQDFIKTASKYLHSAEILIIPSRVQGENAAEELCQAIHTASSISKKNEVIVLARGGGSMEDLQAFNDEKLARAIRSCSLPVVSAVGHETDFTISDFVSDLRAPTPTAAASIIFKEQAEAAKRFNDLKRRFSNAITSRINKKKHALQTARLKLRGPERAVIECRFYHDEQERRLISAMNNLISLYRQRNSSNQSLLEKYNPLLTLQRFSQIKEGLDWRLSSAMKFFLDTKKNSFAIMAGRLDAVSPLGPLSRGYSLVSKKKDGRVICSFKDVSVGEILEIKPFEGKISCKVTDCSEEH